VTCTHSRCATDSRQPQWLGSISKRLDCRSARTLPSIEQGDSTLVYRVHAVIVVVGRARRSLGLGRCSVEHDANRVFGAPLVAAVIMRAPWRRRSCQACADWPSACRCSSCLPLQPDADVHKLSSDAPARGPRGFPKLALTSDQVAEQVPPRHTHHRADAAPRSDKSTPFVYTPLASSLPWPRDAAGAWSDRLRLLPRSLS
jgi:hypothetical protein